VAQELVKMSSKELDRLAIIRRVVEGPLTQAKAGELIGLSERQVRRLCAAFEECGPAGLVSGKRGLPSNRRLPEELRSSAIEIVRERYCDFGPTLGSFTSCATFGCLDHVNAGGFHPMSGRYEESLGWESCALRGSFQLGARGRSSPAAGNAR